jgi:hypothetical protein
MSQSATIIDFAEIRRRRQAPAVSGATAIPGMMWVPVWVMVPLWRVS